MEPSPVNLAVGEADLLQMRRRGLVHIRLGRRRDARFLAVRAGFGEFENGVGLFLQEGKTARAALVLADGKPMLEMSDKQGRGRLNIQVKADGSPQVNLIDGRGKVFWDAP